MSFKRSILLCNAILLISSSCLQPIRFASQKIALVQYALYLCNGYYRKRPLNEKTGFSGEVAWQQSSFFLFHFILSVCQANCLYSWHKFKCTTSSHNSNGIDFWKCCPSLVFRPVYTPRRLVNSFVCVCLLVCGSSLMRLRMLCIWICQRVWPYQYDSEKWLWSYPKTLKTVYNCIRCILWNWLWIRRFGNWKSWFDFDSNACCPIHTRDNLCCPTTTTPTTIFLTMSKTATAAAVIQSANKMRCVCILLKIEYNVSPVYPTSGKTLENTQLIYTYCVAMTLNHAHNCRYVIWWCQFYLSLHSFRCFIRCFSVRCICVDASHYSAFASCIESTKSANKRKGRTI